MQMQQLQLKTNFEYIFARKIQSRTKNIAIFEIYSKPRCYGYNCKNTPENTLHQVCETRDSIT